MPVVTLTRNAMFQTIGIIGFLDNALVGETVGRLALFLLQSGRRVLIEEGTEHASLNSTIETVSRNTMGQLCDLVVVVGGDGSMLHAARDLVDYDVPLLGVNRGRLGFLTDILPSELEQRVADVLQGKYVISQRFMLDCSQQRDGWEIARGTALNDVVLQPRNSIRMIEFSLHIDTQYVYTQRSDGLIISTPTGSTAYALSGGGPIIHPHIDAINIVPINPHTLSNRPIVVDGNSELEIRFEADNSVLGQIVCDGQIYMAAERGDRILVRKKARQVHLLHPVQHDFYETCRTKLHWARDQG